MSTRRIRARQSANAKKRARRERRLAAREKEKSLAAAVARTLVEHNQSKKRRRPALATSRGSGVVEHPMQLPTLTQPHPAMESVQRFNPHIRSAFGRLLFWASANAPGIIERYPLSLLALAKHRANWVRPVELAVPGGKSPRTRLLGLTRFLLEKYPAPRPLLYAIFDPNAEPLAWFCKAARGESLRKVVNLHGFTKRAAHLLWRAPRELPVWGCVRWAQVRALGGDDALARTIATRGFLSHDWAREDGEFWHHFIAWLVAHPTFPLEKLAALTYLAAGARREDANFSMKGRTVERLVSTLDTQEREQTKKEKRKLVRFSSCGLSSAAYVVPGAREGFERTWRIEEILDSESLYQEGRAMRHCVGSYEDVIARGDSAIFSMTREHLGEKKRALTIEVCFDEGEQVFGEVRGKANREPTREELAIVTRWGRRECIRLET